MRAELGPAGEGVACGGYGGVDLGGLTAGDLPEHGAVNGGEVVEGVGGGDPLATDPVAGVDADVGDLEHGEGLPREIVRTLTDYPSMVPGALVTEGEGEAKAR